MLKRLILAAVTALLLSAPAAAGDRIEMSKMMGRWYEVARVPNAFQRGCEAGASDWTAHAGGFAVVQNCWKGAGEAKTWKGKATADPGGQKIRMTFFGGVVTQEYKVLEHRADQGWIIMATANNKYVWLMSQKPTLPSAVKAQAVARIRQLGFDTGRLEFPGPPKT